MSIASRLLSTARGSIWANTRTTTSASSFLYRFPRTQRNGYATDTTSAPEAVKKVSEEFKVASEIPPPSGFPETGEEGINWSKSYHGLSEQAFSKETAEILMAPVDPLDIEMKPGPWVSNSDMLVILKKE